MNRLSPEALLKEVPQYAGASLRPFGSGSANALYLIESSSPVALLRVHDCGARMGADRGKERRIWQQAADASLAPQLYHWDKADRFAIAQCWGSRAEQLRPGAVARILVQLHQLPIAAAPVSYAPSDNVLAQRWQQQLMASKLPLGVTHHDPGQGNWLRQGAQFRLIDFEYAGFGHPLWDLASLMLEWPDMVEVGRHYFDLRGVRVDATEQAALQAAGHLYLLTCQHWCEQARKRGGDAKLLEQWLQSYRQQTDSGLEGRLSLVS